ncbi:hypothetical protein D3C71_382310 [compost metagenome]
MLRRAIFGKESRFTGDLDFNLADPTRGNIDSSIRAMASKIPGIIAGLELRIDPKADVRVPSHGNTHILSVDCVLPTGETKNIKVEIDHRAEPILPPVFMNQRQEFRIGPGTPLRLSCLRIEEVVGEKVRAAYQRIRIRDLYDLSALGKLPFDRDLARKIAVLKMWEAPRHNDPFNGGSFRGMIDRHAINGAYESDKSELMPYLRDKERLDTRDVVNSVIEQYQFLGTLSSLERQLAADLQGSNVSAFLELRSQVRSAMDVQDDIPTLAT